MGRYSPNAKHPRSAKIEAGTYEMSKRRIRQQNRMPLEEKVRLAMVDLFIDYGTVAVEAHDHDDIQGLVVMVTPFALPVPRVEELSTLLDNARALMYQLVPTDHRLHQWTVSVDQGNLRLGAVSHWE
jgi:hypothetical protein